MPIAKATLDLLASFDLIVCEALFRKFPEYLEGDMLEFLQVHFLPGRHKDQWKICQCAK